MWNPSLQFEIKREFATLQEQPAGLDMSAAEYRRIVDAERKREARELKRLARPPEIEERICSICGGTFEVVLHQRGGRVKGYCSCRCERLDRYLADASGF